MILPKIKLKNTLIIAVVGYKKVGKTTACVMLADALFDMGVEEIKHKDSKLKTKPSVVLYDDVESSVTVERIKEEGGIIIYVNGKPPRLPEAEEEWLDYCCPDFYVDNFTELRRFEYELRDLLKNLIVENKKWQQAIEYVVCQ